MPAPSAEIARRKQAYDDAIQKLSEGEVPDQLRQEYLHGSPERRAEILAGLPDRQKAPLAALGEALDAQQAAEKALQAARQSGDQAAIAAAREKLDSAAFSYLKAERAVQEQDAGASRLRAVLDNYRSAEEMSGMSPGRRAEIERRFAEDIDALKAGRPERSALIDDAAAACRAWAKVRRRLSDPRDIIRLVTRNGVLEFRIVADDVADPLTDDQRRQYVELLQQSGPGEALRRGLPCAWFPIRDFDPNSFQGMITAEYAGRTYLLLCNEIGGKMTRDPAEGGWSLTSAFRGGDSLGRPAIDFTFDERGAKQFYALTRSNVGKQMAILLDDEVFSAPRIRSAISSRGQITGDFAREEIDEIIRLLEAGSLPSRIDKIPVSIQSFPPAPMSQWLGPVITTCAAMLGMLLAAVLALIAAIRARPGRCTVWWIVLAVLACAGWLLAPGPFAAVFGNRLLAANVVVLALMLIPLAIALLPGRGKGEPAT